jgi:pimeloyl-ACP methyl ester carboxylesterase
MAMVHHRYATVGGHKLFYREAGPADAPAIVLLHGFPASSFMFRTLIPQLADGYRVIAPDHLGFGRSDAPPASEFDYTFDALTDLAAGLLDQLGVGRYAIYVQDYGAPIGWRLGPSRPGRDHGDRQPERQRVRRRVRRQLLEDGLGLPAGADPRDGTGDPVRADAGGDPLAVPDRGAGPDPGRPDAWAHDYALLSRPGNDLIQLALFRDYASNLPLYPRLHEYLRTSRVPLLAAWGRGDEIFGPDGARAFAADAADAEIHLLDGGHFLLETAADEVAALIRDFLARRLVLRQRNDS